MNLDARIEAVLFASGGPLTLKRLTEIMNEPMEVVEAGLQALATRLEAGSGLQLTRHKDQAELVTHPEAAEWVRAVARLEAESELSKPALETLSILAYRGPLTRPELEHMRGVQSSIILRNLMLRGLVEAREEVRLGQPIYQVTLDFIKHLGLANVEELPDFMTLHAHPTVERVLEGLNPGPETAA